jgi:hypothetical protein
MDPFKPIFLFFAGKVTWIRFEPVNAELRSSHSDDSEREKPQKHEDCNC